MNEHPKTFIAFVKLGTFLREFCNSLQNEDEWSVKLNEAIELSKHKNGWFTRENVMFALENWGELLTENNLQAWLSKYSLSENRPKTVALILAGNIPLVGFHDFLCVLLTGNKVLAKLSSNDEALIKFITSYLTFLEPIFKDLIVFEKEQLKEFDAVIATGSNNTSRYFEHYFGKGPHIIRKNRSSVAIISGKESPEALKALGEDIFRYFGLGCRSVSKIFVPRNYDFDLFFKSIYDFNSLIEQNKYANNYDYNKAVYLMSEFKILDNGFLILKEDEGYSSPIASLFYEFYDEPEELKNRLAADKEQLQCVVSHGFMEDEVAFGQTQKPSLTDYADNIDTVDFLLRT
ncbi:acyl-CoA reductase [Euzebyella saccharophila]|uniref:Acyl-CoA reductase n=1 Tax=Euzebyella saccharophila TaxID=679664 RepID=A0ABV8JYP8_9FLAO|nr:acyl-CoA reductase [Euzebyella saccharophila]